MNCVTPREVTGSGIHKITIDKLKWDFFFFLSSSNPQERQRIEKWREQTEKKKKEIAD